MTRNSPTESATLYAVNYKKKGNDGNLWKVIETVNGVKRWQKNGTIKQENKLILTNFDKKALKFSVVAQYYKKLKDYNELTLRLKPFLLYYATGQIKGQPIMTSLDKFKSCPKLMKLVKKIFSENRIDIKDMFKNNENMKRTKFSWDKITNEIEVTMKSKDNFTPTNIYDVIFDHESLPGTNIGSVLWGENNKIETDAANECRLLGVNSKGYAPFVQLYLKLDTITPVSNKN